MPVHPPIAGVIQRKPAINQLSDEYEREAERVGERVAGTPERRLQRTCECGGDSCADCQKKHSGRPDDQLKMKRVAAHDAESTQAPAIVHDVLRSPGQPLDEATRAFMEPRFGFDFSRVRVHAGAAAAQSACDVSAHAYTVGHHLVFGTGAYAPATREGRRLIAHELAHVVQQTGAGAASALQRDRKEEKTKEAEQTAPVSQDVAVLFEKDEGLETTAIVLAPGATMLRVTSVDDLAKQLKAIKGPVKTLYLVAHMLDDGNIEFGTPGVMTYVSAEQIANKVKGILQVENINFQGCQIAQAPAEMQRISVALKATKATGSTCTLVEQTSPPIRVDGIPIIRPEQLRDKKVKAAFDAGFKTQHDLFKDNKEKCILNDSVDGYFATGGKLIAYWANPGSMADDTGWDNTKSICYRNLKVQQIDPTKKLPVIDPDDCKLIELGKKKR